MPTARLGLLGRRNFALLWWAGLISIAGDWALVIALPVYVLESTGSVSAVSAVVLANLLPNLIFGLLAGTLVDRWDRKRIVVRVNLLRAIALLPLVFADSADLVWVVVAVAFVQSSLAQLVEPAENALLPELVPKDQLLAANSLNSLNNNLGRLVGPALGGVAATTVGLSGAALFDAATFVIAAGLSALITGSYEARAAERHHLGKEIVEGLGLSIRSRVIRSLLTIAAISSIGEGMMGTLLVVYVVDGLEGSGAEMGWLMSAQAVGGILGGLLGARYATRFPPIPLIAACFALFGLIDLVIFNYPRWSTEFLPVLVMFVLVGIPVGVGVAAVLTLLQATTPDTFRGRVFALMGVLAAVAAILGATIAGALGDSVSVLTLLTAQGAGYLLAGLLFPVLAGREPRSFASAVPVAPPTPT